MNADASLTVSIANQPGDIDKAIEKSPRPCSVG